MDRDFLKGLELDKDTVNTIMAEHGKSVQELKESKADLESQLKTSAAEIADLKSKVADLETITKERDSLVDDKQRLTDELAKVNADFSTAKMNNAIEKEAMNAGATNPADILSFIDKSAIKAGESGEFEGIEDAVKSVKESKPYLFGDTSHKAGGFHHDDQATDVDYQNRVRQAMGLPEQKS